MWIPYRLPLGSLLITKIPYEFHIDSPWIPLGSRFSMDPLRISYGFHMDALWNGSGFSIDTMWTPDGFPIDSLNIQGVPMDSLWIR